MHVPLMYTYSLNIIAVITVGSLIDIDLEEAC